MLQSRFVPLIGIIYHSPVREEGTYKGDKPGHDPETVTSYSCSCQLISDATLYSLSCKHSSKSSHGKQAGNAVSLSKPCPG